MFKSKLLYKIIGILIFLIVSFISSASIVNLPKIDKCIQTLEEKNAKGTLDRVVGIAQNSAQNLDNFKKRALKYYKQDLKNVTDIASSILNDYYTQYKEGKLTENEAKKIAYERIGALRYGDNGYFIMSDYNYITLSHINKDFIGQDWSKATDIKGKYFVKEMVDKTRKNKEAFTSYWWKKPNGNISEKLSYTRTFEPWKAYIGTGVYIDDIQKEVDLQKAKLIKDLREIMINTKIGKTGYIYVFNKEGKMIIHPNSNIEGTNFRNLKNPSTSNMLYDDLIKASATTKTLKYKWDRPNDKGNYIYNKTSWIKFVPSLQCYISSSAYTDEFKEVSNELIKDIMRFGILALILATIISILLFKRLLSPLNRFSKTANHIASGDYHARVNIATKDEIGDLAKNFNTMAETIEENIKNLDRKVQENIKELEAQKETFAAIYNGSKDAIAILDMKSNFLDVNPAYLELTGMSRDALLSTSCLALTASKDIEPSKDALIEVVRVGYIKNFEKDCILKDGKSITTNMSMSLLKSPNRVLISVRDVTQIKQNEKTLEEKIKQEVAKNREKDRQLIYQSRLAQMGEMISMIAHQWRQPLAAISATSASIELKASKNSLDSDTVQQKARDISKFSQHLSKTIDDFRDFFKPNKGKSETTYDEVIHSVLVIIEVSLTNKNIQLIQELNCHEAFSTYPNELKQVLLNLIKNAEDTLLEKAVEDPTIKITTYTKKNQYILDISDNAGGIPEDIIEKIFDPYFSTKKNKEGTGLGLYMSKTIIEEHCGGTLSVVNIENGALFKIILNKIADEKEYLHG